MSKVPNYLSLCGSWFGADDISVLSVTFYYHVCLSVESPVSLLQPSHSLGYKSLAHLIPSWEDQSLFYGLVKPAQGWCIKRRI